MTSIVVTGGNPIVGSVTLSGSVNSALKLIYASMFSNEDVLLENIPRSGLIESELKLIRSIGGKAEWLGVGRLILNGAGITSYEVSGDSEFRHKALLLLAGPLLYRFGKALLPKPVYADGTSRPSNRMVDTWQDFGIAVKDTKRFFSLDSEKMFASHITFKTTGHLATDNAIMTAMFCDGTTVINNASEESEIDDLIAFGNMLGANIERVEPRKIKVEGTKIFKGGKFEIQSDKSEAAYFAAAAVVTRGNILINNIERSVMVPFANFLNKVGARFEFNGTEMKVWCTDPVLKSTNLTVAPTPGYISDWQSVATLMLTQAQGESSVHETVFINKFDYTKDLNRMGAKIDLVKPSSKGIVPVISDDTYDFDRLGEPFTLCSIQGPTKLRGERLNVSDFSSGPVLVLAALCAEGKSEISGVDIIDYYSDNFIDKLISLGAKIWKIQE